MRLQEGVDGIVGILEIGELPRAGGASFAAGGGQAFGDAVIAKGAFVGDVLGGMEKTATVGARLNAISAADAVVLIHEHYAIGSVERGAHGTDLRARRIDAVVAEFGDEEVFSAGQIARWEAFLAAVGGIHNGIFDVKVGNVVALHPGTEVTVRHIVFEGAGTHAASAADALGDVEEHAPPVLRGVVVGSGFRSAGKNEVPSSGRGGKQDKELPSGEGHFRAP